MSTGRPTSWPRERRRIPVGIVVAAGLLLGLSAADRVSAASIAAGGETTIHGHQCKCRMHCKTACCCAHDAPSAHKSPATATHTPAAPARDTVVPGPCVTAAPCGGAALPTETSGYRLAPTVAGT